MFFAVKQTVVFTEPYLLRSAPAAIKPDAGEPGWGCRTDADEAAALNVDDQITMGDRARDDAR